MGLDNFPVNYPCRKAGTAVLAPRRDETGNTIMEADTGNPVMEVLCTETQIAGGCPWLNANPPTEGRVYGMFGCDCWYRGKYGNALLSEYASSEETFYGDNDDSTVKSPESCLATAEAIGDLLVDVDKKEDREALAYAEWYLRWAAEQADGLFCWY